MERMSSSSPHVHALYLMGLCLACALHQSLACTSFFMPKNVGYGLIGRTMDYETPLFWQVRTYPQESTDSIGFVGIESALVKFQNEKFVSGGLNVNGVTCDAQILVGAKYESFVAPFEKNKTGIFAGSFCGWVLSTFKTVRNVREALESNKYIVWGPMDYQPLGLHFVVRDKAGETLVVEYVDGVRHLYNDQIDNDDAVPVVTNEPTYDFHVENVRLLRWKMHKQRTALGIPANFYPDERLLRVYVTLLGIKTVTVESYEEAIAMTISVIDRVHVPRGEQYGTDTGNWSAGYNSHTQYSVIYDISKLRLYWKTSLNPSLQGIRLGALDLSVGAQSLPLDLVNTQPFFNDVSGHFGK